MNTDSDDLAARDEQGRRLNQALSVASPERRAQAIAMLISGYKQLAEPTAPALTRAQIGTWATKWLQEIEDELTGHQTPRQRHLQHSNPQHPKGKPMTYDRNNECTECGEHIADPHAPECPAATPR